jgi:Uma2 family endonuclease
MAGDSVAPMSETFRDIDAEPWQVDYPHLPGEEKNPLMESTQHADWVRILVDGARATLADTDRLVTGNVPFLPLDSLVHLAPDLMVIPGAKGRSFGRYVIGPDNPPPEVCVEVVSPSNTRADIVRRSTRMLRAGVAEMYVLDPIRETVVRVEERDGERIESDAVGIPSPGLAMTFVKVDGQLALCCPAGRLLRTSDVVLGWLADVQQQAFAAQVEISEAQAERKALAADRDALAADRDALAADRDSLAADRDSLAIERDELLARIAELEGRATPDA